MGRERAFARKASFQWFTTEHNKCWWLAICKSWCGCGLIKIKCKGKSGNTSTLIIGTKSENKCVKWCTAVQNQDFLMMIIVLLFFSISSIFVWKFWHIKNKIRPQPWYYNASVKAQSCAETYKAYSADLEKVASTFDGDFDKNRLVVYYDENWQEVEKKDEASYTLTLKNEDDKYISTAKICVEKKDGKSLFEIKVKTAKQKLN